MKKLNRKHHLIFCVVLSVLWFVIVSITKKLEPFPDVDTSKDALNGDFISINQNGVWITDIYEIKVLDDDGNIKQSINSPTNSCLKFAVSDSFVGFHGNCEKSIYKINSNNQSVSLSSRLNNNAVSEIYLADTNILAINSYGFSEGKNYKNVSDLRVYSRSNVSSDYGFNYSSALLSIICDAHCEMDRGEVYYFLSQNSEIRKIDFNQKNMIHQSFSQSFERVNKGFYNMNKLSDNEMVLMIDNKMYFYEISPLGLFLKSTL